MADNIKAMAEWGSTIRTVRDQSWTNGRVLNELVSKVGQNYEAISRLSVRGHA